MAVDESSHASTLKRVRDTQTPAELATPLSDHDTALVSSVESELKLGLATEIRSLDDAYEVAHRIESSEIDSLFALLLGHMDETERHDFIELQFAEHTGRLEHLSTRVGRAARRDIIARS